MDVLNEAHQKGLVVGLRDATGGVVPRIDIDELLLRHPLTFNLLIIALKELKSEKDVTWPVPAEFKVAKGDKFSYFQIAGIHGLPLTEWDHEKAPGKTPKGDPPGYCTHASPAFGTWHRPYMAMIEQTLFRHIANVAERFGQSSKLTAAEKKAYVDAAKQFRMPYWDYYRPRDYKTTFPGVSDGTTTTAPFDYHMPQIFTLPEIMVKTLPNNELKAVGNPFWQYKFGAGDLTSSDWQNSGIDLTVAAVREHTLRWGGNDESTVSALNNNLNKIREDEMRVAMSMIEAGAYSNFGAFSTAGVLIKGVDPDNAGKVLQDAAGSIEGLHNNYHVYIGGSSGSDSNTGHMSLVPVAAFDPVFWIHHNQIDRLFAIWQAVNPTHWFNDLPASQRSLADGNLLPFRKPPLSTDKKSRYWTSNQSKDPKTFGYTYPDISDGSKSAEQLRADFAAKYGWSRRLTPFQHAGTPPPDMLPLDLSKAQVYQYTSGVASARRFRPLTVAAMAQPATTHLAKAMPSVQEPKAAAQKVTQRSLEPEQEQEPVAQAKAAEKKPHAPGAHIQAAQQKPLTAKVSHEWYIDCVVARLALNGSFTIFYIIGDVQGTSGSEWSTSPGLVGVTHVFASPTEACDNCGNHEEQAHLVTSTSPITSLLLDYVETAQLASMEAADVQPFLVKKLKWRVQTATGEVINPRHLFNEHSLRLSISCKTAPLPGEIGEVQYSSYPQVIDQIIAQSS